MENGNKVKVYDTRVEWLEKARINKVGGKCEFAEGPLWHPDGYFLFSDTPANCIYRLGLDGHWVLYINHSGCTHTDRTLLSAQIGSNGLALDKERKLLVCQHGNHGIARQEQDGSLLPYISNYQQKPFNSPNDLLLHSNGSIFFTDPPYGLKDEQLQPALFQPRAGVYVYKDGEVQLIGDQLNFPNGLIFSADERHLYVSSNDPSQKCIVEYALQQDGAWKYAGVFVTENADGMTTDDNGNMYLATNDGVLLLSATGERLALITLAETPTNLAWGGENKSVLLVTARTALFFIERP
ncbi:MAG TPA: SMP-30/gluconolactonase/LRE family protein [Chitinophagaceae bacterium]|nr:SMP-30/gluconolactonase/LRE family protein [Chitinophagaceae bacterium]